MSKFSKNIKTYKTKTDLKVLANVVQNQWRCQLQYTVVYISCATGNSLSLDW